MLRLGLSVPTANEPSIELSDVLSAEIAFKEAYQEFIDYMNVCEIVTRAKISEERMGFASELLGTSVENIQVSAEKLSEIASNAWKSFSTFWSNIYHWIIDHISELYQRVKKLVKGELDKPFKPVFSTYVLEKIEAQAKQVTNTAFVQMFGGRLNDIAIHKVMSLNEAHYGDDEKIIKKKDAEDWLAAAKRAMTALDRVVSFASKYEPEKLPDFYKKAYYTENGSLKPGRQMTKDELRVQNDRIRRMQMQAKNNVMVIFRSISRQIQRSINVLKGSVSDEPNTHVIRVEYA